MSASSKGLQQIARVLIGGVLLWAAAANAINPSGVLEAMDGLLPATGRTSWFLVGAAGFTCVEGALGFVILSGRWRRVSAMSAAIFFAILVGATIRLGMIAGVVSDASAESGDGIATAWWGTIRNLGFLGVSLLLVFEIKGSKQSEAHAEEPTEGGSESARAFSLVELLVVIVVLGVLLALALPMLSRSKISARQVRTVSTLRQIHVAVWSYAEEWKEALPYLGYAGEPWRGLTLDQTPAPASYFSQSAYYINLLYPSYFSERADVDQPGDYGVSSRQSVHFMTPYRMTQGAFAAPEYWRGDSPPTDLTLYRSVRVHEALFPGQKVLILHMLSDYFGAGRRGEDPGRVAVVMMDGGASRRPVTDAFEESTINRPYGSIPVPGLATVGGLAGRDFD